MSAHDHICVCICTYKRPELLADLLSELEVQKRNGQFDYSIIVVDNDRSESARAVAESFARDSILRLTYDVVPEQSIPQARNRAVALARGSLLAFIDDDEVPDREWLLRLYLTLRQLDADGVLGPVVPRFTVPPPQWITRGRILDRPRFKTGSEIDWRDTGTGNMLVRRHILDEVTGPFNPDLCSGGEDTDFFRRAMELHKRFVWCDEAIVHEIISVERTRLSVQLRRALLRGKASLDSPAGNAFGIAKSLAAVTVYTVCLPAFFLMGRHVFSAYLIKNCDHIGKLLAASGFNIIKEKYIL